MWEFQFEVFCFHTEMLLRKYETEYGLLIVLYDCTEWVVGFNPTNMVYLYRPEFKNIGLQMMISWLKQFFCEAVVCLFSMNIYCISLSNQLQFHSTTTK